MKISELADIYNEVAAAKGDPARVKILSALFRKVDTPALKAIVRLTMGELVDPTISDTLNVGPGLIRDVIAEISGHSPADIEDEVKESGDMSDVIARYAGGKDTLTVTGLWKSVDTAVRKNQDRAALLQKIFTTTTPDGARYIARMVLNQMRINAGTGTLVRSIAAAFAVKPKEVEQLYTMTNDMGIVAERAKAGEVALEHSGVLLFHPYQFMNAQRAKDADDIFSRFANKKILWEIKYDGARLQIHIQEGKPHTIRLYSRRLNEVTSSLPDVVEALQQSWCGGDAIIEAEALAFEPGLKKKLPFQMVMMRLGRKHEIEKAVAEMPFVLNLFELVYHKGEHLFEMPQIERRERLRTLFTPTPRVKMTEELISENEKEALKFFKAAVAAGHEGLMAKNPDAPYIPGKRTDNWLKLKPAYETLDVVITGAIWGSGRNKGVFSSFEVSVLKDEKFVGIGNVGAGFTTEIMQQLTTQLEPLITTTKGRTVEIEPQVVIEVDFQDIQKMDPYEAGYVLRIPRFKRIRTDKGAHDVETVQRLKQLYGLTHK